MDHLTELTNFLGEHVFGVHWRTTPNAGPMEGKLSRTAALLLEGEHTKFGLVKAVKAAPETEKKDKKKAEKEKADKKGKKGK